VSPLYKTVIEWEPTANAEVLYVTLPPPIVPDPNVAPPSMNVTVPVAAAGDTTAANITSDP
jgi:hypothetical protein